MSKVRTLAVMVLPLAANAYGAPAADIPPLPDSPQLRAPIRPCLVDSVECLSLAPQPFRPCLAIPRNCGDHFGYTPVIGVPLWLPASWAQRPAPLR
jgi:hypothetical protein